jgi:hypothetical protein
MKWDLARDPSGDCTDHVIAHRTLSHSDRVTVVPEPLLHLRLNFILGPIELRAISYTAISTSILIRTRNILQANCALYNPFPRSYLDDIFTDHHDFTLMSTYPASSFLELLRLEPELEAVDMNVRHLIYVLGASDSDALTGR